MVELLPELLSCARTLAVLDNLLQAAPQGLH
ncbi:hypothetical protein DR71_200 [Corynebacterium sp. ATCC 6931]|nr:hypothetical protein DR71_200 [Corynebacterium sp. ATCC 6931]